MVASSPIRNDISALGGGSQVEMQPTAQAYLNQSSSSSSSTTWMMGDIGGGAGGSVHHQMMPPGGVMMGAPGQLLASSAVEAGGIGMGGYDHLGTGMLVHHAAGLGSDDEECFDNMSDQDTIAGDDSMSSAAAAGGASGASGLDETRIQQL